jgi:hypothetical protein
VHRLPHTVAGATAFLVLAAVGALGVGWMALLTWQGPYADAVNRVLRARIQAALAVLALGANVACLWLVSLPLRRRRAHEASTILSPTSASRALVAWTGSSYPVSRHRSCHPRARSRGASSAATETRARACTSALYLSSPRRFRRGRGVTGSVTPLPPGRESRTKDKHAAPRAASVRTVPEPACRADRRVTTSAPLTTPDVE